MKLKQFYQLQRLEKSYWWFVGRKTIVTNLLKHFAPDRKMHNIIELGCGTGATLQHLNAMTYAVGIDHSPTALKLCRVYNDLNLIRAKADNLPIQSGSVQAITALDLIEHLPEEEVSQCLKEAKRILQKGGCLLLTVPAYPFLWSAHDKALGHYRRYTIHTLKKTIHKAGFKIEKISYFCSIPLPVTIISRVLKKCHRKKQKTDFPYVSPLINKILIALMKIESMLLKKVNIPCGSSIICIATKHF